MTLLEVECPACNEVGEVPLEDGDLAENKTTEGIECECENCGRIFSFDLRPLITNKKVQL